MIPSDLVEEDRSSDEIEAGLGQRDEIVVLFAPKLEDGLIVARATVHARDVQEVVAIDLEEAAPESPPEDPLIALLIVEVLEQRLRGAVRVVRVTLVVAGPDLFFIVVEEADEVPSAQALATDLA